MNTLGVSVPYRPAVEKAWSSGTAVFWDRSRSLYGTRTALLSREWLVGQYDAALSLLRNDLRGMATRFMSGSLGMGDFRLLARREIETAMWEAAMILHGPGVVYDPALMNVARQMIQDQFAWLDGMFNDVLSSRQKLDGSLARRSGMYSGAGWSALFEFWRWLARSEGKQYEENVLGDAEHCGGCVEETAKGKVPIGTLVPVGQRTCLSNCRCVLIFS